MTATPTIPYETPTAAPRRHSWIGVVGFALGAFAAGGVLLSTLAVAFPLMNAPASWETPAAIFGITMFVSWLLCIALSTVAMALQNRSRLYPVMGFLMVILSVCLAAVFVSIA